MAFYFPSDFRAMISGSQTRAFAENLKCLKSDADLE